MSYEDEIDHDEHGYWRDRCPECDQQGGHLATCPVTEVVTRRG